MAAVRNWAAGVTLSVICGSVALTGCGLAWGQRQLLGESTTEPISMRSAAPTTTLQVLYDLKPEDGSTASTLLQASNGQLYGYTSLANRRIGSNSQIFRISPEGELRFIYQFNFGEGPISLLKDIFPVYGDGLIQAQDGKLYGTTPLGLVYQLTLEGEFKVFSRLGSKVGSFPNGLVQGKEGSFYGVAPVGQQISPPSLGTIFRIGSDGQVDPFFRFTSPNTEGVIPLGPLVAGVDGDLYGLTAAGGPKGGGTLYRLSPSGSFTVLHEFDDLKTNLGIPPAHLLQATDGSFYGTRASGGESGFGSIFHSVPDQGLKILHTFSPEQGIWPVDLIQGRDGLLYGITAEGGTHNRGTIFRLTPEGDLTVLLQFSDREGASPTGIIQGDDGNLYGATSEGGQFNRGTIFKVVLD